MSAAVVVHRSSTLSSDLPSEAEALIGVAVYRCRADIVVERGAVQNWCAALENANPLYWDGALCREIAVNDIAPPTMLSVWSRAHSWRPDVEGEIQSLQVHFDLKRLLQLPEAVIVENELVLGDPVQIGDRLHSQQRVRSISPLKQTRLGSGRYWVIDVEYHNDHGDYLGAERYTALGYSGN